VGFGFGFGQSQVLLLPCIQWTNIAAELFEVVGNLCVLQSEIYPQVIGIGTELLNVQGHGAGVSYNVVVLPFGNLPVVSISEMLNVKFARSIPFVSESRYQAIDQLI
jgi:hypothetical protein